MPTEIAENSAEAVPAEHTFLPIARIHSCFTEKFGIPRQPGLAGSAIASMEMLPPFDRQEMFRGLEEFSHIWIHFLFHQAFAEGWRPTVRPPWLGGQKRVGVFASRSPHRPNFIGLSVVRLVGIRTVGKKIFLDIAGIDILDQTPVFDIKPYLPYSDGVAEASGGYTSQPQTQVQITFSLEAEAACVAYQLDTGRNLQVLIREILQQDPRPASQRAGEREHGMLLWDVNIRWQNGRDGVLVLSCEQLKAR